MLLEITIYPPASLIEKEFLPV